MLNLEIVAIDKLKYSPWQLAVKDYLKRLKPYCRIKITELPAESFRANTHLKARRQEADRLLKYLHKLANPNIFLLTEGGQKFSSESLASWLEQFDNQGTILVIGGALGFSQELKNKFPAISLSPLTFPHELARVILLEQIYRAICLQHNKTYHY